MKGAFLPVSSEYENWTPPDSVENPKVLNSIADPAYKQLASDINGIWAKLGRQMKQDVHVRTVYFLVYPNCCRSNLLEKSLLLRRIIQICIRPYPSNIPLLCQADDSVNFTIGIRCGSFKDCSFPRCLRRPKECWRIFPILFATSVSFRTEDEFTIWGVPNRHFSHKWSKSILPPH